MLKRNYTGYDDINGIGMHENDIVQYELGVAQKEIVRAPIVLNQGKFCLKNKQGVCISLIHFRKCGLHVIGNMKENSYLLND